MPKSKLIIHEKYDGKRSAEEVFAAIITSIRRELLKKSGESVIITNRTISGFTLLQEMRIEWNR